MAIPQPKHFVPASVTTSPYLGYAHRVLWGHLIRRAIGTRPAAPRWHLEWTGPRNRYLYLTLRLLSQQYPISVRVPSRHIIGPKTYAKWLDPYARLAYTLPNVEFVHELPADIAQTTLFFDEPHQALAALPWARRVRIRTDIATERAGLGDWLMAPYSMHPWLYQHEYERRLPPLRATPRSLQILFAGNADPASYSSPAMRTLCDRFGYETRPVLVADSLSSGVPVTHVADVAQLDQLKRKSTMDLVIATDDTCRIPWDDWMRSLAASNFFLCLPGNSMPMCHNAIEAMAVGAIPILMYGEWFHPRLVHGETCLAFTHRHELPAVLKAAQAMPPQEIARMRRNVFRYYDQHLTAAALVAQVDARAGDLSVFFNFEQAAESAKVTRASVAVCSD